MIRSGGRHIVIPDIMQVQTFAPRAAAAAAASWWEVAGKTCVAAYQPKGAASYAASLVNLANPGIYDCAEGATGAVSWSTATGWSLEGDWPWTYLLPGILYDSTDCAMFIRFANRNVAKPFLLGTVSSGTLGLILNGAEPYVTWQWYNGGSLSLFNQSTNPTSGVMGFSGNRAYWGDTDKGEISSGSASGGNILLSAQWEAQSHAEMDIIAFWRGSSIDAAQVATLVAAMAAL